MLPQISWPLGSQRGARHSPAERCGRPGGVQGFRRVWQFRSLSSLESGGSSGDSSANTDCRTPELARLEALLFVAREPLSARKITELADLADGNLVRTLIGQLNECYAAGKSALSVEEVAGGFQLRTRPGLAPWLRRLPDTSLQARLSAPAMETLTVVAYRQPILRASIEAIRGVQCGDILRQLMERDLVRIVGRSDDLGRPLMYGTTKRFLELFGLGSLSDLPRAGELKL
jgi:segregation and condensation protein B